MCKLVDRYSDEFRIPAADELLVQYAAWRGWDAPWWVEDEDDTEETA